MKRKPVRVKPQFSDKVVEAVAAARRCVTGRLQTDPGGLPGAGCRFAERFDRKAVAESF